MACPIPWGGHNNLNVSCIQQILTGALCSRLLLRTGFSDSFILSPDFGSFDLVDSTSGSSSDWSATACGDTDAESLMQTTLLLASWQLL